MSLTEWPSLIPTDHTQLETGMILTLEPGIVVPDAFGGDKIMVHEENIVITPSGPVFLSPKSSVDMPVI
jgi:Xaa-Pro aminopeptidase